jgi:phosphatidylserine/phosphatidylglycerophosphate/cardiolipin synthase-like enzyme
MEFNREKLLKLLSNRVQPGPKMERRYELFRKMVLLGTVLCALAYFGGRIVRTVPVNALQRAAAGKNMGEPLAGTAACGGAVRLIDSPEANLERVEIGMLSRATQRVDVAMYSFTDLELARELVELKKRGVEVRVYRDSSEYKEEERRSGGGRETATAVLLNGGVPVRVKEDGDLMHLKSYAVDGSLLRTGSANWSLSGLKRQDNDVAYIESAAAVKDFETKFNDMWLRADNAVLQ